MSERFESIQKGVEEAIKWKNGKKTGARVRTYTAMDVAKIRKKTKMSQKTFSAYFGIPVKTAQDWEQGRVPTGAAKNFLCVIDQEPYAVRRALTSELL